MEEIGAREIAQSADEVLLCILRCSEHETGTCTVTIQYGDEDDACLAECPPQGNCKSVIEGLIMANNVHEKDAGS